MGYDFLKIWIFKNDDMLYCVSYQKNDNSLSIRGLYYLNSIKSKWIKAVDFSDDEHNRAQESLLELVSELNCVVLPN
jgi:hypothetical protein